MRQRIENRVRNIEIKLWSPAAGVVILLGITTLLLLFTNLPAEDTSSISVIKNKINTFVQLGGTVEMAPISQEELTDKKDNAPPTNKHYTAKAYLKIPSINLNAPINYVGKTRRGAMAVPSSPYILGWYKHGPYPGEDGSAVIAGHSGFGGIHAVFDYLPRVKVGNLVTVSDKNGNKVFKVYKIKYYKPNQIVRDVFNRSDGKYLNLVTCTGTWNYRLHTHSKRLVVYTKLTE